MIEDDNQGDSPEVAPTSLIRNADAYHAPVLMREMIQLLGLTPGDAVLDATLGGGGHSAALLKEISPNGVLIGLDRDAEALRAAEKRFEAEVPLSRFFLLQTAFGDMEKALSANEETAGLAFHGMLFDLGVSSHQLDSARGFSFRRDEKIDMRMDASESGGSSAEDLLAEADEDELARILWEYGEENWSRRIAKKIVESRKEFGRIETTGRLVSIIEASVPRGAWPRDIHVATRSFQGLRIAVNDELGQLEEGLIAGFNRLRPGGRMAVMSFHSLEDRIVKRKFAEWSGRTPSAPGSSPAAFLPNVDKQAVAKTITRKPVVSEDREIQKNPRARSAKMRVIEKL